MYVEIVSPKVNNFQGKLLMSGDGAFSIQAPNNIIHWAIVFPWKRL
jgi:hypothetical protein